MKVMTFLGTRPEIIRLSRVIPLLDKHCKHVLVHTGQNFDERLSGIFFDELQVRKPDHFLGARGDTFGEQIAQILVRSEALLRSEKPDVVLILGDTNSGLPAIIAARMRIPIYHMEAGNRCYDDRVPEEVNRRIIDHCSTVLLPYTQNSKENLVREGIPGNRIYVTGNPIFEVIQSYDKQIEASKALGELGLEKKKYFLVTMHRAENVDIEPRLKDLTGSFLKIAEKHRMPVICSLHPRTKNKMEQFGIEKGNKFVRFLQPFGFFDFVKLQKNAICVLTDSGTVQEECCILGVPNVTIRDVTERPETLEAGSNILSGGDPESILRCVQLALEESGHWTAPREYLVKHVAATVVRIVTGYRWPGLE